MTPRPIFTAPLATGPDEEPIKLLLYCPDDGGWHGGEWLRAGYYKGVWERQGWRATIDHDIDLRPTHWLPCPEEPAHRADASGHVAFQVIRGRE